MADWKPHVLLSPEGRSWGAFREWAQKLEAKGSPAWLGLSVSAEKILKIKYGNETIHNLLGLFSSAAGGGGKGAPPKGGKLWLQALAPKLRTLAGSLPAPLSDPPGTDGPIERALLREHTLATALLDQIRADLEGLIAGAEVGGPKVSQQL